MNMQRSINLAVSHWSLYQVIAEQKKRRFMGAGIARLPMSLPTQFPNNQEKALIISADSKQSQLAAKIIQEQIGSSYSIEFAHNKLELLQAALKTFKVIIVAADYDQVGLYVISRLFQKTSESKAFLLLAAHEEFSQFKLFGFDGALYQSEQSESKQALVK